MSTARPYFTWSRYVLGLAFLAAVGFALWGYGQSVTQQSDRYFWSSAVYASLQMFVLEFNLLDEKDEINWQLHIARWLAAAVSAGAILLAMVQLFHARLAQARIQWLLRHTVICGAGRKGTRRATLAGVNPQGLVIIDNNDERSGVEHCRQRGAHIVMGDATDPAVLLKANIPGAQEVVITCGKDHDNLEIALRVRSIIKSRRPAHLGPLRCYVHIGDTELVEALRQQDFLVDGIDCQFFNHAENCTRTAFSIAPLEVVPGKEGQPTRAQVELVIVGFGSMGQAIALQAARIGQFRPGTRLRITVIDPQAQQREHAFLARYPNAREVCDFNFEARPLEHPQLREQLTAWANDPCTRLALALCLEETAQSVSLALNLPRAVRQPTVTLYLHQSDERELSQVLTTAVQQAGPQIVSFGGVESYSVAEMFGGCHLDEIAQRLHEGYRAQRHAAGNCDESDPALAPWEQLSPGFRTSNRLHADHIDVKLRAIGCRRVPSGQLMGPQVEAFTPAEVELMAEMEHARWCAERYFAGWQRGAPKDKLRKISPELVPWAELPEATREYDRAPVRSIPTLLAATGHAVERLAEMG